MIRSWRIPIEMFFHIASFCDLPARLKLTDITGIWFPPSKLPTSRRKLPQIATVLDYSFCVYACLGYCNDNDHALIECRLDYHARPNTRKAWYRYSKSTTKDSSTISYEFKREKPNPRSR